MYCPIELGSSWDPQKKSLFRVVWLGSQGGLTGSALNEEALYNQTRSLSPFFVNIFCWSGFCLLPPGLWKAYRAGALKRKASSQNTIHLVQNLEGKRILAMSEEGFEKYLIFGLVLSILIIHLLRKNSNFCLKLKSEFEINRIDTRD